MSAYRAFRVPPKVSDGQSASRPEAFIGVIDASGSMRHCWPDVARMYNLSRPKDRHCVTITFDQAPHVCESNILSETIRQHGGGMTNISAAFTEMDRTIAKLSKDTHITVLFISDGQDNAGGGMSTLEQRLQDLEGSCGRPISFICLGIQSQFPTFISMYLRELYHTTQSSIPALFLVEYASEKAFFNKFETIQPFLSHVQTLRIEPPVRVVPWMPPSSEVYENQFLVTRETEITLDGVEHSLSESKLSAESVAELFRGYVQALELVGLGSSKHLLQEQASVALQFMLDLLTEFKRSSGLDFAVPAPESSLSDEWAGVAAVAAANFVRHSRIKVTAYVENVRAMAEGHCSSKMAQYDAAKRIGVGTVVGKQVQKALALTTVPVAEFARLRDSFLAQARGVDVFVGRPRVTKTQREVFEADTYSSFAEGLGVLKSQYDLMETLPLVGLAVLVKRSEGLDTDTWRFTVKRVLRDGDSSVPLVASSLMMAREYFKQESLGYKSVLGKQEANCVVPLFSRDDEILAPLVRHPLFHLLMTCNVTLNADALFNDAYFALLSSCFLVTLSPEEGSSVVDMDLLASVQCSAELVYGEEKWFRDVQKNLVQSPDSTPSSVVATIFHLFLLIRRGAMDVTAGDTLLDSIGTAYLKTCITTMTLQGVLTLQSGGEPLVNESALKGKFVECRSLGELRRQVGQMLEQRMRTKCMEEQGVAVKVEKLRKNDAGPANLQHLERLAEVLELSPVDGDRVLRWARRAHCVLTSLSQEAGAVDIINRLAEGSQAVMAEDLFNSVRDDFVEQFKEVHKRVVPMCRTRLRTLCTERSIDYDSLHFNPRTGLASNACMAPQCPFFLQPQDSFGRHLDTWRSKMPMAFHRTVKMYNEKHPAYILAKFVSGDQMRSRPSKDLNVADFDVTEDWVLEYVRDLAEAYKAIALEDDGWEFT